MVEEIFEIDGLTFKPFSTLSKEDKKTIGKSWKNPFNARFNGQRKPYSAVKEIAERKEPTFSTLEKTSQSYYDTMYFRAIFYKEELIGTCRFGVYHRELRMDTWDFGFNILLKHWSKGYGKRILEAICKIAQSQGVKYVIGGASNDNFGSYNAMVKSGFKYKTIDADGDFQFKRDLTKPIPSGKEIKKEWELHIERYIERFGEEKYNRLNDINTLIKQMVKEIQNGKDEDKLVKQYYKKCNRIEKFPEKSVGV